MQEAVPQGQGGMVALMPVSVKLASEIANKAAQETGLVCEISNINSPKQVNLFFHHSSYFFTSEHYFLSGGVEWSHKGHRNSHQDNKE